MCLRPDSRAGREREAGKLASNSFIGLKSQKNTKLDPLSLSQGKGEQKVAPVPKEIMNLVCTFTRNGNFRDYKKKMKRNTDCFLLSCHEKSLSKDCSSPPFRVGCEGPCPKGRCSNQR